MRLDAETCRTRFAPAPVARLATVAPDGTPHLVPVTFAIGASTDVPVTAGGGEGTDGVAWFAVDHKPKTTTRLGRLDNIRAEPRVSLLVDEYADDWGRLWWVRADGTASEVDGTDRDRGLETLARKYRQYRDVRPAGPVVMVRITRWTGWAAA